MLTQDFTSTTLPQKPKTAHLQANNDINDETLDEEYYIEPAEFRFHDDDGFCYDPNCPCKEDQDRIGALGDAVQEGLASVADADRIYQGRTV